MSAEEFLDACEQESVMVIFPVENYNIYFVDDNDNRVGKHQVFNAVEIYLAFQLNKHKQ